MQTAGSIQAQMVGRSGVVATLALCFIIALLEGVDNQSMGVAAPFVARHFGFSPAQMGLAFSIGSLGLLPGAMLGGRLADRLGRKPVLIYSVVVFGIFSIMTAHIWDANSLIFSRFMTGLGLGAAMPNLIALVSEIVPDRLRRTAVSFMYCGIPLGGAIASAIGALSVEGGQWRHVFYVGGFAPLILVPLLIFLLPESRNFLASTVQKEGRIRPAAISTVLFGERRTVLTIALWVTFFFTLSILFFLMNWLPSLLVRQGIKPAQVGVIQVLFNVGGAVGAMGFGWLMDRTRAWMVVLCTYVGIVVALVVLSQSGALGMIYLGAALAGLFLIGAQSILYGLSAVYYPIVMRGTGSGSAVAVGRFGSFFGPFAAGELLAMGFAPPLLIGAAVPLIVIALISTLVVVKRPVVKN
ncbi:MAG: 3-(3-hydroxy-phenyl)propionate transporter MhpT [Burkholderiaceae bacterium]|nr:MAG: 3-(3-hydroxy-phenyl)propionate transporter MhpT [Burkholderiaceae bacterium]